MDSKDPTLTVGVDRYISFAVAKIPNKVNEDRVSINLSSDTSDCDVTTGHQEHISAFAVFDGHNGVSV